VPSFDAADPLSGKSKPVYRENMEIAFALFHLPNMIRFWIPTY
jgi:hypothetical protein